MRLPFTVLVKLGSTGRPRSGRAYPGLRGTTGRSKSASFGEARIGPVYSGGSYTEIADVVAWIPSDPSRWFTLCNTGHPLGDDALHYAEFWSEPVTLHPSPLAWLAADGEGVVIADWPMSSPALRSVPYIITDDVAFGREVERRLTMPVRSCPEIRVRVGRAAA